MANVIAVAEHVLKRLGSSSTMKLQKIVYYSQAYHLVRYGQPLFSERIEAWRNGPVVRDLYDLHAHEFVISVPISLVGFKNMRLLLLTMS